MHSKIQEWLHHPVSKSLIKVLQEQRNQSLETVLNLPEDSTRDLMIRKLERIKVLNEILDIDNLLLGEIEE